MAASEAAFGNSWKVRGKGGFLGGTGWRPQDAPGIVEKSEPEKAGSPRMCLITWDIINTVKACNSSDVNGLHT